MIFVFIFLELFEKKNIFIIAIILIKKKKR